MLRAPGGFHVQDSVSSRCALQLKVDFFLDRRDLPGIGIPKMEHPSSHDGTFEKSTRLHLSGKLQSSGIKQNDEGGLK
jgi:hypothetical protein